VLVLCAGACGCMQRRMTIRSNPPGALVYVDNYEIGTTPCSTHFIYYGTREIRLVKDGYKTVTVKQKFSPPWYEIPPLDFFSENFVPGELRDQRTLTFQLEQQMIVPTEQLMDRAEHLRAGSLAGVPMPNSAAPPMQPSTPGSPSMIAAPATTGQPAMTAPADLRPIPQGTGGQPVHTLPPGGMPVGP